MRIPEFLFNLLVFSLPLGVVVRITIYPNVSIYPYDVITGLILIFFAYGLLSKKIYIEQKKIFKLVLLFLLVGFISLIINSLQLSINEFLVSFAYLARYAAYLSLIFAISVLDNKFKKSLITKLIISGVIFTMLGFIQFIFYSELRNLYYLGWDEHLYRLFSTFLDPNFAGAFLVLILLLISGNILRINKLNKEVIFNSLSWVLVLFAVYLTYSRSALIMLIVGFITLFVLYKKYKLLVPFIVGLILIFFLLSNRNFEGLNPFRIASVEARLDSAVNALTIIADNPLIGIGFNSYRYAQMRYGFIEEETRFTNNAGAGTDNSYLFVLATTGIFGLASFIYLWFTILKKIYLRIKVDASISSAVFASLVALLINAIFINSLFYAPIMAWIFILVGITVNKKQ